MTIMADRATESASIALRPDNGQLSQVPAGREAMLSNKGMASFMLIFLNLCSAEGILGGQCLLSRLYEADFEWAL